MNKLLTFLILFTFTSCAIKRYGKEKINLYEPLHSEVHRSRIGYFHEKVNCFETKNIDSREILTVPVDDYQIAIYHFADGKITWNVKMIEINGSIHKKFTPVAGAIFEVEVKYCKFGSEPFDNFGTTYASFRLVE